MPVPISAFGIFHTVISVIAVVAGAIALIRDGEIISKSRVGQVYILTTVITCVTGFGLFHHGGFGKAHVLGIITLVVLAIAWVAGSKRPFGRFSPYVEIIGYTTTFFFQWIPALTETSTRLPVGRPLVPGPDAPALQAAIGVVFVIYLIGAAAQVWRLRARLG